MIQMNNNSFISKKQLSKLLPMLICIFFSATSHAQSSIVEKAWGLETIDLKEISRTRAEVPVKYFEVKEIMDCIFQKIELKNENKCILWDYHGQRYEASYSATASELVLKHDNKEFKYQYNLNNSRLTLNRNFSAGNVSGVLVDYKISLQFSTQN